MAAIVALPRDRPRRQGPRDAVRRGLFEPVGGEHRVEHAQQVISPSSTAITSPRPATPGPTNASPTDQPARSVPAARMTRWRPNRATSRARHARADQAAGAGGGERQAVLPRREAELAEHEDGEQRRGRHDQAVDEDRVEEQRAQGRVAQDVAPAVEQVAPAAAAARRTARGGFAAADRADTGGREEVADRVGEHVVTGPSSPIAAPPSGGPSMVAVQVVDSRRPLATSRSSGRHERLRQAPLAARNAMSAAPATTATTRSCANLSRPRA